MAIFVSNIVASIDPSNPSGGTVLTFTRSDTGTQASITVPIQYIGDTATQEIAQAKAAIQAWEAEQNGLAALNTAASGQVI
jgi:hypothetical protein